MAGLWIGTLALADVAFHVAYWPTVDFFQGLGIWVTTDFAGEPIPSANTMDVMLQLEPIPAGIGAIAGMAYCWMSLRQRGFRATALSMPAIATVLNLELVAGVATLVGLARGCR